MKIITNKTKNMLTGEGTLTTHMQQKRKDRRRPQYRTNSTHNRKPSIKIVWKNKLNE